MRDLLPPVVAYLAEAGRWAPSADNSQPWEFHWSGEALELRFARERLQSTLMGPSSLATLLAMGAVIENWQQAAAAASLALEWLEPPNNLEGFARIRIPAQGGSLPPKGDIPLFQRCTNRQRFQKRALPEQLEEQIAEWQVGQASVQLVQKRDSVRAMAALTRQASAVRFRTREIHEWFLRSLRWDAQAAAQGDGLDLATLHLPPGGYLVLRSIATWRRLRLLNRFGAFRLLATLEVQPLTTAPALILIHAPPERDGALAAGQAMERAWIALNCQGLGVQPFYVLPDQLCRLREGQVPTALESVASELATNIRYFQPTKDARLMMVMRIGEPRGTAVQSQRLPLDSLIKRSQSC